MIATSAKLSGGYQPNEKRKRSRITKENQSSLIVVEKSKTVHSDRSVIFHRVDVT